MLYIIILALLVILPNNVSDYSNSSLENKWNRNEIPEIFKIIKATFNESLTEGKARYFYFACREEKLPRTLSFNLDLTAADAFSSRYDGLRLINSANRRHRLLLGTGYGLFSRGSDAIDEKELSCQLFRYSQYCQETIYHRPDFILYKTLIEHGVTFSQLENLNDFFSKYIKHPLNIKFIPQFNNNADGEYRRGQINVFNVGYFANFERISEVICHELCHHLTFNLLCDDRTESLSEMVDDFAYNDQCHGDDNHTNAYNWGMQNFGRDLNAFFKDMLPRWSQKE